MRMPCVFTIAINTVQCNLVLTTNLPNEKKKTLWENVFKCKAIREVYNFGGLEIVEYYIQFGQNSSVQYSKYSTISTLL